MTDVWVAWPTVNVERSKTMVGLWQEKGYKVILLVNPPHINMDFLEAEMVIVQPKWQGFAIAANALCWEAPGDIVVVVGDDIYPDKEHTAKEIARDFKARFPDLNGVMQPTGDKFGWTHKCAVSPWIGRKFIETSYNGHGPYWERYYHYFSDQELQEYAAKLGLFQQREDLSQFHDHWQRKEDGRRPPYLMESKRQWHKDKRTFEQRMAKGFPDGTD